MKRFLQISTMLLAASLSTSVFAGKQLVCHKSEKTISIADTAVQAHLDHGDVAGACPELSGEDGSLRTFALMRCDAVNGEVSVVAASSSQEPVATPFTVLENCATAMADLISQGYSLESMNSGTASNPGVDESGFQTEYLFVGKAAASGG